MRTFEDLIDDRIVEQIFAGVQHHLVEADAHTRLKGALRHLAAEDLETAWARALDGRATKAYSSDDMKGIDVVWSGGNLQVKSSVPGAMGHVIKFLKISTKSILKGHSWRPDFTPVAVGVPPQDIQQAKDALTSKGLYVSPDLENRASRRLEGVTSNIDNVVADIEELVGAGDIQGAGSYVTNLLGR
jgi:hypothetical protein